MSKQLEVWSKHEERAERSEAELSLRALASSCTHWGSAGGFLVCLLPNARPHRCFSGMSQDCSPGNHAHWVCACCRNTAEDQGDRYIHRCQMVDGDVVSEPGFLPHCFQMFPCMPCKRKTNPEVLKPKQAQQHCSQMFSVPKILNQRQKHWIFSNKIELFLN